jgi:hypothetical protein
MILGISECWQSCERVIHVNECLAKGFVAQRRLITEHAALCIMMQHDQKHLYAYDHVGLQVPNEQIWRLAILPIAGYKQGL